MEVYCYFEDSLRCFYVKLHFANGASFFSVDGKQNVLYSYSPQNLTFASGSWWLTGTHSLSGCTKWALAAFFLLQWSSTSPVLLHSRHSVSPGLLPEILFTAILPWQDGCVSLSSFDLCFFFFTIRFTFTVSSFERQKQICNCYMSMVHIVAAITVFFYMHSLLECLKSNNDMCSG